MTLQYNIIVRKKDNSYQYIVSYKENGKWKQKSKQGFSLDRPGKKKAKAAADEIVDQLKERFELNEILDNKETTFGEFKKSFLEHIKLYREHNTYLSYKVALNQFDGLDDKNVKSITSLDIQGCIDSLVTIGRAESTIKQYLVLLKATFRAMKSKHNLISDVPFDNIVVPNKKSAGNKKALTPAQYRKLLSVLKDKKYYMIVLMAGSCGMRIGEIIGLTWDNFNKKKKTLTINTQWKLLKDGTYGFGSLKSKNSKRTIPLSSDVVNHLSEYYNLGVTDRFNRIFVEKSTQEVTIALSKIFRENNFDITIHELRHTFITNLIADGLDFKTVAHLAGDDVVQIMNTYSHVTEDMMKFAAEKIENLYR